MASPLKGADGNVEFLIWLAPAQPDSPPQIDVERVLDDAYNPPSST
jgi:hypothetical protein